MFIYIVTNKVNGKKYVGKTIRDVNKRCWEHVRSANKGSVSLFHKAIHNYGINAFEFESINFIGLITEQELGEIEQDMIFKLKTFAGSNCSNGYNMTVGGESGQGYGIKIKQYDLTTGIIINIWMSQTEAEKHLNISSQDISNVCNKRQKSAGGYGWCFISDDPEPYIWKTNPKQIIQFNLQTLGIIKKWDSIKDAILSTKIQNISNVCNKRNKSAGGYGWCFASELPSNINIKNNNKKIIQIDLNSNRNIKYWNSIKEAGISLNIEVSSISKYLRGKLKSAGGFGWKYA